MTIRKQLRRLRRRVRQLEARTVPVPATTTAHVSPDLKRGPWTVTPREAGMFEWVPTTVRFEASNKPETNEGEAVPAYLVEPYTYVAAREGIYFLKPGEEIRIPFKGAMRLLWERQYLEQEKWREHVARNKVRAPRRPEYAWLEGTISPPEFFWLNPDHYYHRPE